MKKRHGILIAVVLGISLILSACGSAGSKAGGSMKSETGTAEGEAEETEMKQTEVKQTTEAAVTENINTESINTESINTESIDTESVTPEKTQKQPVSDPRNNYIVVTKSDRQLTLYNAEGNILAQYPVGLAQNPLGAKEKEGDKKTPEGEYYICVKNTVSKFHKALGLSYPNIQDAQRGLEAGLISQEQLDSITSAINAGQKPDWYTALGGEVMIHGQKGDLGSQSDWTTGCIAVDNEVIDALWDQVQVGTKVTISP